uniref:DUF834 domain-containing protein n=1 Tax=Oryza glaberrima TaxID=4538 RepID=I1PK75_ORYGL
MGSRRRRWEGIGSSRRWGGGDGLGGRPAGGGTATDLGGWRRAVVWVRRRGLRAVGEEEEAARGERGPRIPFIATALN